MSNSDWDSRPRIVDPRSPVGDQLPAIEDSVTSAQRVLLVDDEPGLLEALRLALTRAGRDVVACRAFDEAREKLLTEKFDVLVTDVRLGAFNGIQLAVVGRSKAADMKIIVFSGFDDPVLKDEAARLGASYLVKPVTAEALIAEIASLQADSSA